MKTPEKSTPPNPSEARLQESRLVDRQVMIDITKPLDSLFPDSGIDSDLFKGEIVAELQVADVATRTERQVGIYHGTDAKGDPAVILIDGEKVVRVKPGAYVHQGKFALMIDADYTTMVLDNPATHPDLSVSAYVYSGPEPYERTY